MDNLMECHPGYKGAGDGKKCQQSRGCHGDEGLLFCPSLCSSGNNVMNLFTSVSVLLSLLIVGLNASLLIKDLPRKTYEVGQVITIEWLGGKPDDLLTIDVINDRPEVMIEPFVVITDIFVKQKTFDWKIPRFLKSSGDYHLRVYFKGQAPNAVSGAFSIINPNPMRASTLNLLEPTGSADGTNLESTCLIGEQCFVLWDYPDWAETAMPKLIDIKLYDGNQMILVLAQGVPVGTKSFLWRVPDSPALKLDHVHVVVAAAGKVLRPLKPGESYYLASAGYPFRLETRSEREQRRLANSQPRDFTAPGPIQVVDSTPSGSDFQDVPRPTYAGSSGYTDTTNITATSGAGKIEPALALVGIFLAVLFF